jgi:F-type H+-transporting ATPase subunit b
MNPAQMNLNPTAQFNPVIIVATIIIFVVTFVLLRRWFVLPYVRVLEERERLFEAGDTQLAEAGERTRTATQHAEQIVADAVAQAAQVRDDARAAADKYRHERIGDETARAASSLEQGRAEIARERAAEVERVRTQAHECVRLACERLQCSASDEAVTSAVTRALARHTGS